MNYKEENFISRNQYEASLNSGTHWVRFPQSTGNYDKDVEIMGAMKEVHGLQITLPNRSTCSREQARAHLKKANRELQEWNKRLTEEELREDRESLVNCLEYFVNRVEAGTIKSKVTYEMFKNVLKTIH